MASHRVVAEGVIYEVEDGERLKPRGTDDEIELLKCGCTGDGCEDITIEYPGAGLVVRNTGTHRVRVGMQMLSGWDCGRWTHFKLHPGESKRYPTTSGYCCPYEAEHY
jgi:hypothetical protein